MQRQNIQQSSMPAPLSQNPDRAMQEMMDTIDALRGVYVRETEALESVDTKAFLSLQEEKLQKAQAYQAHIQELLSRKEEFRGVNPVAKKTLERMQSEFQELSSKNMDALKRMQRTMERLGGTIRNAAKDAAKKERAFSYNQSGQMYNDDRKTITTGLSETA